MRRLLLLLAVLLPWLAVDGASAAPSVRLAAALPAAAQPGRDVVVALRVAGAQRVRAYAAPRAASRPVGRARAAADLRRSRRARHVVLRLAAPAPGRWRVIACAGPRSGRLRCTTLPGAVRVAAPPAVRAAAPPAAPSAATAPAAMTAPPAAPAADPVPVPEAPPAHVARRAVALGTAVWSSRLTDRAHAALVERFDSLTLENELKWEWVQPVRGTYAFAAPDAAVAFAQERGLRVRGHTLVWHQQLPPWVSRAAADPDDLRQVLDEHVRTVVGHFAGRIESWDVVNEPLTEDGVLRDDLWSQALGREYLRLAFQAARAADPDARLFLNEVAAEGPSAKADGLVRLVAELLADGVPVDGVGLQLHTNAWGFPSQAQLETTMRRLTDLGVDVELTEADVGALAWPAAGEREARQLEAWRAAAGACAAVPRCTGLTVWGVHDGVSWLGAPEQGTLLDADGRPKPAYELVRSLLTPPL
ncbi:MAG TPA: endo-1,4-beta-xylanase [Baekduia sp.]|nr:endo-1,4-beta-xylanase [Baekduia sp.]